MPQAQPPMADAARTPAPEADAPGLATPVSQPGGDGPHPDGGAPRPGSGEPRPTVPPAGAPTSAPPMTAAGPQQPSPDNQPASSAGCTAPQLRRFIKSRPYVPMHELRRRFGINGAEDDVTPVDLADGRVFVGLPAREGGLLGELLRGGEIGYELSLDPRSPVVVGLYPMRPVPRV